MTAQASADVPKHIGVVGYYLPRQIVFAANATPVQLHGSWQGTVSSEVTRLLGAVDAVTARLLTELLEAPPENLAGLVVCNDSAAHLKLFYVARMLSQRGVLPYPVLLLDCPSGASAARYRFVRWQYERLSDFLGKITGTHPSLRTLNAAGERELMIGEALEALRLQRWSGRLGSDMLSTYLKVSQSTQEASLEMLRTPSAETSQSKVPVFMTGSHHPDPHVYQQLEDSDINVVGEDHPTGDSAWLGEAVLGEDIATMYEDLATMHFRRPPLAARSLSDERARRFSDTVERTNARYVVSISRDLDDAHVWDAPSIRSASEHLSLSYHAVSQVPADGIDDAIRQIRDFITKDEYASGTTQRSVTGA